MRKAAVCCVKDGVKTTVFQIFHVIGVNYHCNMTVAVILKAIH